MFGQTYFPLKGCSRYYADFNGNVITTNYKQPRKLKQWSKKGAAAYTLQISGKTYNVRATRIAYCIRNNVSLESISGKYIFTNGDKLELHSDERFAGIKSPEKRKMKKPENGKALIQRAKASLEMFAAWYEDGDIRPLNKHVSQLKRGLKIYAISRWSLAESNAQNLVEETCSQFFLSICERNLIRFGIESYLKRLMACIYKRDAERRAKERLTDADNMYHGLSLSDWEGLQ